MGQKNRTRQQHLIMNILSEIIPDQHDGGEILHALSLFIGEKEISNYFLKKDGHTLRNLVTDPTPLALWFLKNYWRIVYDVNETHKDWTATHALPYAAEGEIWPPVVLKSDDAFKIGRAHV